ncbi:terminase large subunit domain-containing protein [Escherichia coli]|uniref:terminase large subunit domain-containing protein n=1 Tax=Escherichia coli TaxID=562 RepID=UPI00135EB76C|nr:terminase family protein [Escherichia coli]MXF04499.1 oxidoreductase [Escherichia coli]
MDNTETDIRTQARTLYWMGRDMHSIAHLLGVKTGTLYTWKRRYRWDEASTGERAHSRTLERYLELINRPADELTGRDFKVIDLYGRQIARLERALRRDEGEGRNRRQPKNHLTDEQIAALQANADAEFFAYQKVWFREAQLRRRVRMILKSRQVGASWYFAREALLDALTSGRNQIFLSASRNQAMNFKRFIQRWVRDVCGVELKGGNEIVLSGGATLYFLGTSAATAQSYTGNLYFDEFFWVSRFMDLRKVASGMATHDKAGLTVTYFSTPSSEEHEAYDFWSGELYNSALPRDQRVDIPLTHEALKDGLLCDDGIWRQILTIQDAIEGGLDKLVTLSVIRNDTPPDDFRNLYMCEFVSRGECAFDYNQLIGCGVDGMDEWDDWHPDAPRPVGDRPVWLGYDPNGGTGHGDSAGLVVLVPPAIPGGRFRVVEIMQLQGLPFEAQAEVIRQFTERYNVTHIGIDGTGVGEAIGELVRKFFPAVTVYTYSAGLKRQMVLKGKMVLRAGRFEYDAGMLPLVTAFMTIRRVVTPGGVLTYESDRTRGSHHGDLAWATLQALFNEPLGAEAENGGFVMEF